MSEKIASSRFQEVIETVEALPPGDQALLIEIVRQRLIQQRRAELAADITEARNAYQRGEVRRGTVADLMEESVLKCSVGLLGIPIRHSPFAIRGLPCAVQP